jgi:hypothetical protein
MSRHPTGFTANTYVPPSDAGMTRCLLDLGDSKFDGSAGLHQASYNSSPNLVYQNLGGTQWGVRVHGAVSGARTQYMIDNFVSLTAGASSYQHIIVLIEIGWNDMMNDVSNPPTLSPAAQYAKLQALYVLCKALGANVDIYVITFPSSSGPAPSGHSYGDRAFDTDLRVERDGYVIAGAAGDGVHVINILSNPQIGAVGANTGSLSNDFVDEVHLSNGRYNDTGESASLGQSAVKTGEGVMADLITARLRTDFGY